MSGEPIPVVVDRDLESLIPGFLARRKEDVDKLARAIDERDLHTVRITGHSMKGTGGGYGFDALSMIGEDMERAAREGDLDAVRGALARLRDYLDRVQVRFE